VPTVTCFVLRHKLLTALFWITLAVAGAVTASTATHRMTTSFSMPGAALTTDARITALYHAGTQDPAVPVITLGPGETMTSEGVATGLEQVFAAAAQVAPATRIVDYSNTGDAAFVTRDGRSTYALVFTPGTGPINGNETSTAIQHAMQSVAPPAWSVQVTGIQALAHSTVSKGAGVLVESIIGALGALVVLTFVFASLLAMVPLVVAAISILTTYLAVLGLTEVMEVSQVVQFLIALIGLGVAIDYSLLVVTRWREERAHGRANTEAIEAAMASAGRSVIFSGVTVAVGLLALIALPVPFLRSTGIGGVLIPLVSVAVTITLLPVLLAIAGPKLDWPRVRTEEHVARGWSRWGRLTVRRRWITTLAGLTALGALIVPAFALHVGEPRTSALAQQGTARSTLAALQEGGVPSGVLTPIDVLTSDQDAEALTRRLAAVPGVRSAVAPDAPGFRYGGTALVTVLPLVETNIGTGQETVRAVRAVTSHDPAIVRVGGGVAGSGAATIDFAHDVYGNFPPMLALIALGTFVLLARAFRSLLLPLKAVLMNLASLAAAYGVMVLVWQQGHGSNAWWGIPATGAITMWVPVMVFAFLFGLSMDYEVFILARMREVYDATGSTHSAVVEGIGRTGRLVTSAALILVLSFLAMSTGPETDLKILATGLGAGILVDATIVRCLLVPALVSLLGKYNWWLPAWAARLLRVDPSPLSAMRLDRLQEPLGSTPTMSASARDN
jgi:RND superfamily putative drug exporter